MSQFTHTHQSSVDSHSSFDSSSSSTYHDDSDASEYYHEANIAEPEALHVRPYERAERLNRPASLMPNRPGRPRAGTVARSDSPVFTLGNVK